MGRRAWRIPRARRLLSPFPSAHATIPTITSLPASPHLSLPPSLSSPPMDRPIVACIQHRLLVPKTPDEYLTHLHRFLRTAKAKGAVMAVFPELSGVPTVFPSLGGWRNSLLKEADQARRPRAGFWQRTRSKAAAGAAGVVGANLRQSLVDLLMQMPESVQDAYISAYASLARQYEMTIVAGSVYDIDPQTRVVQNIAAVLGPDGSVLGRQAKAVLTTTERDITTPADGWSVISSPVGRIGILLGNDALFPEPARILAYQGADMLIILAATTRPGVYHKIRDAALARCQENQLYGMVSFVTGPDPLAPADAPPYVGASAIFAPLEFTRRFTGVMIEVGSPLAEGVITAEWDYEALAELWQSSDTLLRWDMPMRQIGPALAQVYSRALPLADSVQLLLNPPPPLEALPPPESPAPAETVTETETKTEPVAVGTDVVEEHAEDEMIPAVVVIPPSVVPPPNSVAAEDVAPAPLVEAIVENETPSVLLAAEVAEEFANDTAASSTSATAEVTAGEAAATSTQPDAPRSPSRSTPANHTLPGDDAQARQAALIKQLAVSGLISTHPGAEPAARRRFRFPWQKPSDFCALCGYIRISELWGGASRCSGCSSWQAWFTASAACARPVAIKCKLALPSGWAVSPTA